MNRMLAPRTKIRHVTIDTDTVLNSPQFFKSVPASWWNIVFFWDTKVYGHFVKWAMILAVGAGLVSFARNDTMWSLDGLAMATTRGSLHLVVEIDDFHPGDERWRFKVLKNRGERQRVLGKIQNTYCILLYTVYIYIHNDYIYCIYIHCIYLHLVFFPTLHVRSSFCEHKGPGSFQSVSELMIWEKMSRTLCYSEIWRIMELADIILSPWTNTLPKFNIAPEKLPSQ